VTVSIRLPYGSRVACGSRPARRRRTRSWRASALFFLEVFGLAVVLMGGAMVLAAAPQGGATTPAVSDVPQGYNDTYLESFAKGPGRGWYVLGQVPCATDHACERPSGGS
jgi:hypothetical protein